MLSYVPAFVSVCAPLLKRWKESGAGARQRIDRDMTGTTLQALQDTVLGAGLGDDDRRAIQEAGATFLFYSMWKVVLTSLRLPPTIPHPGARKMARAGKRLRETAEKVLAKRDGGSEDGDLLGRLVTARDPATGSAMPARLIIDNVVTFLMAGHETTSQALTWTLYLLALFPDWQERVRDEVRRVAGGEETGRDDIGKLQLLDAVLQEAMRLYSPAPVLMRRTIAPVSLDGIKLTKAQPSSFRFTWSTAISSCGRTRSNSIRRASRRKRRPAATAAPICRSGPDRALASARLLPCSKERPSSQRFSHTPVSSCPTAKRRYHLPASRFGPKMGSLSK